jgi:peptidoglycan/xylan/chitin deacetylase (PgdA/CDA1 family)
MKTKRDIIYLFLDKLGINALFRFLNRHQAIILWYHGVADDDFTLLKGYDERHIPQSLFRKQLKFLRSRGYTFVTMTELMDALQKKKSIKKFVVLTFDDGFRNIVENAYPIMREEGGKGCFFLVSQLIGNNQLLWTDHVEAVLRNHKGKDFQFVFNGEAVSYDISSKEKLELAMRDVKKRLRTLSDRERKEHMQQFVIRDMSLVSKEFFFAGWDQIRRMDRSVLEVGSHTRNHPNCAQLTSTEEFKEELMHSKTDIEKNVGYEIKHFCYPAGSFNDEVIDYVRQFGYQSATTIIPGFNNAKTPPFMLRRISVDEDFGYFKASISGSLYFLSGVKQRLKGRTNDY